MLKYLRTMPLHGKVLAGLVLGSALGGTLGAISFTRDAVEFVVRHVTDPVGQLFLRLLLLLVIPLVVSSLALGVAGLGDIRRIGRVGLRCLAYTVVISAISVVIGLGLTNLIRPGERVDRAVTERLRATYASEATDRVDRALQPAAPAAPLRRLVETLVPTNPISAAAREPADMLGLMFVVLFLAIAMTTVPREKTAGLLAALEGLYETSSRCVEFVMKMAPYAVFCLMFTMTARFGFGLLASLGWYVATVLLGLAIHMFGVYSLSVRYLSKISPREFFRRIETVIATAFSTSSSNATLPTALRVSEEQLGVPREINAFVLTVGATANQNGTALFEGVTVLFLAQLAGVDLSLGQQLSVLYLAILGGIGTAGVPSGSIPFVIVVLSTVGVNPELIALILGVDRLLDMCRTTLNVTGDITAATYVARAEGYSLAPDRGVPGIGDAP